MDKIINGTPLEMVMLVDSNANPLVQFPTGADSAKASTAATSTVVASLSATSLIAANTNRKGVPSIFYDGAATLYVLIGAGTVSATNYTIKLGQGFYTYWEPPLATYTGAINGLWSAAVGSAQVTEYL